MSENPRYEFVGLTQDAGSPIDTAAMMREAHSNVDTTLTPEQEHITAVEPWGVDSPTTPHTGTGTGTGTTITQHHTIYVYRVTITPTPSTNTDQGHHHP